MEKSILNLHGLLRLALLFLLFVNIIRIIFPTFKNYKREELNWGRWLLLIAGANFVTVVYLYLYGKYGFMTLTYQGYLRTDLLQIAYLRFWLIEYPTLMLLSSVLIIVAFRIIRKKNLGLTKYKKACFLYIAAFLIIIIEMPWKFRNTELTIITPTAMNANGMVK